MTGRGELSIAPNRSTRRFLILAGFWVVLLLALVSWWAWVLSRQAVRISELEQLAGMTSSVAHDHWERTQRMLIWESATFLVLLAGVTFALFRFYWVDTRRARSLQAFFASVTHELKTPLTSIRLQSESIAEQGSNKILIDRLLEDTSRLEAQVERTLELARVEGGGRLFEQPLPIETWLQRNVSSLARFKESKMVIKTKVFPPDLVLNADPGALQMILRNLVENSVRYSKVSPVEVTLEAQERKGRVLVTYSDNGQGFSGNLNQLGQLFYRGEGSQGAGVGLYLVQKLMERMSGKAIFESSKGAGFKAHLWFTQSTEEQG